MIKLPLNHRTHAFAALAANMNRIRYLSLGLNPGIIEAAHTLLSRPAPFLEEFHLRTPEYFNINQNLFSQTAPLLATLTIVNPGGQYMPTTCPALENVRKLIVLNAYNTTSLGCLEGLFRICPRLRELSLQSAPRGPMSAQGTNYVIQLSRNTLRGLESLTVLETTDSGRTQAIVPTLHVFDYKTLATLHVRGATATTAIIVFEELHNLKYFFFMRAAGSDSLVIVRDSDDRKRIFSRLTGDGVDKLLMRIRPLASALTSIALWEYVYAGDLSALVATNLPVLRIITIFMRGSTLPKYMYSPDAQHIFAACRASGLHWDCPALETLCFTSHAPVADELPPVAKRPELSAVELKVFAQDSLRADLASPPELVLDGVLFHERFNGAEVAFLRQLFSRIDMDP
ncbi:hypothetical protein AURDEDRAFT_128611 [Auricularia subglabra TFB-10046 SS5]|nr:hypothetical protein AURDEDRAFT_128611 [Auricularia subglabra TFB-10046 SS5]